MTSFKKFIRYTETQHHPDATDNRVHPILVQIIPPLSWLDILFFAIFIPKSLYSTPRQELSHPLLSRNSIPCSKAFEFS